MGTSSSWLAVAFLALMVKASLSVLGKPGQKVTEKPPVTLCGQRVGELENTCVPQGRVNS